MFRVLSKAQVNARTKAPAAKALGAGRAVPMVHSQSILPDGDTVRRHLKTRSVFGQEQHAVGQVLPALLSGEKGSTGAGYGAPDN